MDLPLLLCTLTGGLVVLLLLELIRRFLLSEPQGKRTVNTKQYGINIQLNPLNGETNICEQDRDQGVSKIDETETFRPWLWQTRPGPRLKVVESH